MFESRCNNDVDLFRLNFSMLTLIPKESDARSMEKSRPISLLNCNFKAFTKVNRIRLTAPLDRLISNN
jgi:hypothetical protein